MERLVILIAKSGISLYRFFSQNWEVAVCDYSRLEHRAVQWWTKPKKMEYSEIVIADHNLATSLTQRGIEREIRRMGIRGPVRYAGNPKTLLAFMHQTYLIHSTGMRVKDSGVPDESSFAYLNRFNVNLVGWPGSGKSFVRHRLEVQPEFSVYRWGDALREAMSQAYGTGAADKVDWSLVEQFTREVEHADLLAVPKALLSSSDIISDDSQFVVLDGIKNRKQSIFLSQLMGRPAISVWVKREESERKDAVIDRNDVDDRYDVERQELLKSIGVEDMINFADFEVDITRCSMTYDNLRRRSHMVLTDRFLDDMHALLSWLCLSDTSDHTLGRILNAEEKRATESGYALSITLR